MVEPKKQQQESSQWWWFDRHGNINQKRSPRLQSTLAELDEKTKAMLKLIEEEADSFAQRAEMYYKKRPELISMVEEFYRTHRSLAERYDKFKSESGTCLITPRAPPLSVTKCGLEKLVSWNSMDKIYDSSSETYETEESEQSDVEDPEPEEEVQFYKEINGEQVSSDDGNNQVMKLMNEIERLKEGNRTQKEQLKREEVSSGDGNNQVMKLMEEIDRLKEENRAQQELIMEKDEEKREVIRQLSLATELLREENLELRKRVVKDSPTRQNHFELNKLKEVFWRRLFKGYPETGTNIVSY